MNAPHELPLHAEGVATQENYVGQSVPRSGAKKLLEGRGTYLDDLRLPRLVHVVFFRSPHAHANIKQLDLSQARKPLSSIHTLIPNESPQFRSENLELQLQFLR